jgi:recombination protein RecA
MPSAARIELEALLRARKLDGTLTTSRPYSDSCDERISAPTGTGLLDGQLEGGLPRGQISEIVGPRSSGRTSLLLAMLAAATARGELVALVDVLDMFDPESAACCGIDLTRLLWVRGQALTEGQGSRLAGSESRPAMERLLDRAIKALNLILQAGIFGLVALDLAEVHPWSVRWLPFTTWFRLQRVIEGSETVCVLLGREPIGKSSRGVTIALQAGIRDQGPGIRAVASSGQGAVGGGQPVLATRSAFAPLNPQSSVLSPDLLHRAQ